MNQLEYLTSCPLCGTKNQADAFLSCKDELVSGDLFHMEQCQTCQLVYTNPRPNALDISDYYKSEEYISHSNAAKSLFEKTYQLVRKLMMGKKLKLIKSLLPQGSTILDIGCGTGSFLQTMRHAGYHVMGIEPNEAARKIAQTKNGHVYKDINALIGNKPSHKEQLTGNQQYNNHSTVIHPPSSGTTRELQSDFHPTLQCVTLWHVLEHIHDFTEHLKHAYHLLDSRGYLIIAVPMYKSLDAAFYKHHWAAYDLPRHLYHFDSQSLNTAAEQAGFKFVQSKPLPFDAFYVSLLSEKYRRSLPAPIGKLRALFIGLLSNIAAAWSKRPASSQIFVFQKNNG